MSFTDIISIFKKSKNKIKILLFTKNKYKMVVFCCLLSRNMESENRKTRNQMKLTPSRFESAICTQNDLTSTRRQIDQLANSSRLEISAVTGTYRGSI